MKILRVCPVASPAHLLSFRRLHGLKTKSFAEQVQALRRENVLLPGGWASAMEAQGYEVFETLYPDVALQARWALENRATHLLLESEPCFRVLLAQVKAFCPDLIFLYAGALYRITGPLRAELRTAAPPQALVVGFWGDELPSNASYAQYFGDLDFAFCSSSLYQRHFEHAGIPTLSIGNCFDPALQYEAPAQPIRDFVFCGSSGYGYSDHIGRYEKLVELIQKSSLEVYSDEPRAFSRRQAIEEALVAAGAKMPGLLLRGLMEYGFGTVQRVARLSKLLQDSDLDARSLFAASPKQTYFRDHKPLRKRFPSRVKPQVVNGSDYYRLLAESRVVLNIHRDEEADIANIRCFEATGVGSCLITDHGEGMREFFDIENDMVTFETVAECLEKVRYLLDHPTERQRIAENGKRTTLQRHTVGIRCAAIAAVLSDLRKRPGRRT